MMNLRAARVASHARAIDTALVRGVVHIQPSGGLGRVDQLVLGLYAVKAVLFLVEEGDLGICVITRHSHKVIGLQQDG